MTSSSTQHDERILEGRVVSDQRQHGGPAQGTAIARLTPATAVTA